MIRHKYLVLIVCFGCFILGLSACSKGILAPAPTRIILAIETSATVNLDIRKKSAPIVIRFYQLKSPDKFNEADFLSLYENDKQVLGDDLVYRQEILLSPYDKKFIEFEPLDTVKTIAALAAFRLHQGGRWRALVMVEPHKTTTIHVSIAGTSISMKQK
ncbi:MAG: type VI secretion system lipoprotein TssJ [Deltaproteobacteria bacterium]|nr:type VI secretion system lipoprotein TssJ [Candidatus Tharpella aukensis]